MLSESISRLVALLYVSGPSKPHSTWRRDCVAVSVMISRPSAGMSPVTPAISNALIGVELEFVDVSTSTPASTAGRST
jgi:hypothetical protein